MNSPPITSASVDKANANIDNKSLSSLPPPLQDEKVQRIYLFRHGETDWNGLGKIQGGTFDIPLNENGRQQAKAVALAVKDVPFGVVASSHLKRASETADAICASIGTSMKQKPHRLAMDGFGEMKFGEFEGLIYRGEKVDKTTERYQKFLEIGRRIKHDATLAWYSTSEIQGESTNDVSTRSVDALKTILKEYPNERYIAIVGHSRMNRILLASLVFDDVLQYDKLKQGNTCINVIDFDVEDGQWKLQTLNYTQHLEASPKKD